MANPFRRADRHGAPSTRPTPPESAETPMPDPTQTSDLPVNRPPTSPSAETPMEAKNDPGTDEEPQQNYIPEPMRGGPNCI